MTRNVPASIRARLKQKADSRGENFDLMLTRFALERLLYRLAISKHADNFLLKGALLFSLWFDHPHRPTRDADLLGFGSSELEAIADKFRHIVSIPVDDGIEFNSRLVSVAKIRKQDGYGGVRIDLQALLDRARIAVQVDVGFGDAVTPAPEKVTYPVLLDDLPSPQLRAYSKYTVIAEKLHAICLLGMSNSRMKDYFDLYVLSQDSGLNEKIIADAIASTFKRRKMEIPGESPIGLTKEFASDAIKIKQWNAFVARNALKAPSLDEAIQELGRFVSTPLLLASVQPFKGKT